MSAFTIDITQHLEDSPKFLKIHDHTFKVNDRKNTVIRIQQKLEEGATLETMNQVLEFALGKEAVDYIEELDLTMQGFQNIFIGVMSCINAMSYEETEKRFRNVF